MLSHKITEWSKEMPRVSVVVLTCNRKKMVSDLIENIQEQSYPIFEIILVDNCSSDNTFEHIRENFPDVKVLRRNDGNACSGRNIGIKTSKGDLVVTLDDDVFFNRKDEVSRIVTFFKKEENAKVLNFKILYPETQEIIAFNWYHPRDFRVHGDNKFLTDYISEGAVAFRKSALSGIEWYPEEFFISHEGPDLAYRIMDMGHDIYYSGSVEVLHKCSPEQRSSWRNVYFDTRNYFWFLIRNMPASIVVVRSLRFLLISFLFSITRGHVNWYFRAIFDSVKGFRHHIEKRSVVGSKTLKKIRDIRKDGPRLLSRTRLYIEKISTFNKKHKAESGN